MKSLRRKIRLGKIGRAVLLVFFLIEPVAKVTTVQAQEGRGPYLLGPNDVLAMSVFRQPDLSLQIRIQSDSSILVPVVGKVFVGGLSEQEAAERIQDALIGGSVIRGASVNLRVASFASKQVAMLGHVNSPGAYYLDRPMRITDILARAGGVNAEGADYLIFRILMSASGGTESHEIPLDDLIGQSQAALNMEIGDGDTIFVPRAPVFYIYGEVQSPGMYRLFQGVTIEQALAQAGGVTELGDRDKIRRREKTGEKRRLARVGLDEQVSANDVFYIGRSLF